MFDDPDSPYLLIERAFREKCIFMDYIVFYRIL